MFTSPTTDKLVQPWTMIYSPAGSKNKTTGDLEQLGHLETLGELGYPEFPSPTTEPDIFSSWIYEQRHWRYSTARISV